MVMDKIGQVEWHPLARGLLAILGIDNGLSVIKLWNTTTGMEKTVGLKEMV
jgi:hypothetical protein